jgi:peptide/nickel transport system permease protein
MLALIARRLAATVVLLGLVSVLAFSVAELAAVLGTDPVMKVVSSGASAEEIKAANIKIGRDRPAIERYGRFVSRAVRGDLGLSTHRETTQVTAIIKQGMGKTLTIALVGIALATIFGFSLGVHSAWRSGSLTDRASRIVTTISLSTAPFWFASLLQGIFGVRLGWLPATQWQSPRAIIMPSIAISLFGLGAIFRATRVAAAHVLSQDYVRAARVKGLSAGQILRRHVVRNTFVSIVPLVALQFVVMVGAAVIVENVFAIPGLGTAVVEAAANSDFPVIQGVALFAAVVVAMSNLLSDVVQAILNPKVRL